MPKRIQKRTKIDFWDKVLKENIKKQANFVEYMGIIGLVLFFILVALLWTIRIDLTVPAHEAKIINDAYGGTLIKAQILEVYKSSIQKDQEAKIVFVLDGKKKLKTTGKIIDIRDKGISIPLDVIVKPNPGIGFHGILKEQPKDILMRIIIERKRFISFFIEKKHNQEPQNYF